MLTPRMLQLYNFMKAHHALHEVMPTYDEMRAAMGFAGKGAIHKMIVSMEERGALTRLPHKERAIRLNDLDGVK